MLVVILVVVVALLAIGLVAFLLTRKKSNSAPKPAQRPKPPVHTPPQQDVYDPYYSAFINFGGNFLDQSASFGSLKVTTAACLAQAIASVRFNDNEFIYSGGHGASLNWAFYPRLADQLWNSECYNPTLSGSDGDDTRIGFATLPLHGESSSQILSQSASGTVLSSSSRMAFYRKQGATGYGGCVANYSDKYVNTNYGVVSPFVINQTITLLSENNFHVRGEIVIEEQHRGDYNNTFIAFLHKSFTRIWQIDPTQPTKRVELPLTNKSSNTPLIVSNQDGSLAFALQIDNSELQRTDRASYWVYGDNIVPAVGGGDYHMRALQITYEGLNQQPPLVVGDKIVNSAFVVVGTLDTVTGLLSS